MGRPMLPSPTNPTAPAITSSLAYRRRQHGNLRFPIRQPAPRSLALAESSSLSLLETLVASVWVVRERWVQRRRARRRQEGRWDDDRPRLPPATADGRATDPARRRRGFNGTRRRSAA